MNKSIWVGECALLWGILLGHPALCAQVLAWSSQASGAVPSQTVSAKPPDQLLCEALQLTLRHDPYTFPYQISVSVADGVVTLRGVVESEFSKKRVERTAARVEGVKSIRNLIEVQPGAVFKPDWLLKEDVERELLWSPLVPSRMVSVQVADGVVYLRGEVPDLDAIYSAIANAYQAGAKKVRSYLRVKPHVNRNLGSPWRSLP
ncbi:MAG: BON domain-containing protein [Thermoguttaceae bacterium]|nr:BON domain-containing protein [Thermoguttaceae bacterium]